MKKFTKPQLGNTVTNTAYQDELCDNELLEQANSLERKPLSVESILEFIVASQKHQLTTTAKKEKNNNNNDKN